MIEFEKALDAILRNAKRLGVEKASLEDSMGRVLTEDVCSKINMPPFDKSAMDGYALNYKDAQRIPAQLKCTGFIQAGEMFTKKVSPGECVKIMTGAGLPKGADSVVMVEDTSSSESYVEICKSAKKHRNICFKGEDVKIGQKVIEKGKTLSVSDMALLASIGRRFAWVVKKPRVAVLNTGGEIVPLGRKLKSREIYNSNGPQLMALLKKDGIGARYLGIAKDRPKELKSSLEKGLENDVLLVSGGVSMGDYDLVPEILMELGVKKIFHNVRTKPGKPLFFG
ncbi:MAG: molybdopterin molybdotransferase MoeA, partial [Omnitrophica bacterium]|nr:molybdopterin molybdotransferase MoeA [Candidatus Omnitrophota bacterium]